MNADCHFRKAAIALNNAAVSLLLRGGCREATETLKDAVKIIQLAVAHTDDSAMGEPLSGDRNVAYEIVFRALDRSNRRSACCDASKSAMDAPILHAISSQLNPSQGSKLLTSNATCSSTMVAFPMTIDPMDDGNESSDVEINFEAAVILYNYGIALNCLASVTCDRDFATDDSLEVFAKSYRIFKVANTLLYKVGETKSQCFSGLCTCLASRILLLRAVLLHSLVEVSIHLNMDVEFEVYSFAIQDVMRAINVWSTLFPVVDDNIAAAA